jgi:hypothetical protein
MDGHGGVLEKTGEEEVRSPNSKKAPDAVRAAILRDRGIKFGGLCTNCAKLETCTYPSATSETWFCEEYSFERGELARAVERAEASKAQELPDLRMGLCVNCELRATCQLRKAEGGVWFCEEYE